MALSALKITDYPDVEDALDEHRSASDTASPVRTRKGELAKEANELQEKAAEAEVDGDREEAEELLTRSKKLRERIRLIDAHAERTEEEVEASRFLKAPVRTPGEEFGSRAPREDP
jgi:phage shock protein A